MLFSSYLFEDLVNEQKPEFYLVELMRMTSGLQQQAKELFNYNGSFEHSLGFVRRIKNSAVDSDDLIGFSILKPSGKDPRGKLHGVIDCFVIIDDNKKELFLNLMETYGKEKKK